MDRVKRWRVDVFIGEHEGRTVAEAKLVPVGEVTLTGHGEARLNPSDHDVPEIGDELAVARSLSDLAHQLLEAAAGDIEQVSRASS